MAIEKKRLNCIVCPMGCEINIELTDGKITKIEAWRNVLQGGAYCSKAYAYLKRPYKKWNVASLASSIKLCHP